VIRAGAETGCLRRVVDKTDVTDPVNHIIVNRGRTAAKSEFCQQLSTNLSLAMI